MKVGRLARNATNEPTAKVANKTSAIEACHLKVKNVRVTVCAFCSAKTHAKTAITRARARRISTVSFYKSYGSKAPPLTGLSLGSIVVVVMVMAKRKAIKKKTASKKKAGKKPGGAVAVAERDVEETGEEVTDESIAASAGKGEIPIIDDEPSDEDLAEIQVPADDNLDEDSLQKIFDDASKAESSGLALKMAEVDCPTCGEVFEVGVDPSEEGQEMIQDCQACCHPIGFTVEFVDGEAIVSSFRSD